MQSTQELIDEYNSRRRTERVMAGIKPLLLIVLGILLGVCATEYLHAGSVSFYQHH